jgi:hypothetical protein
MRETLKTGAFLAAAVLLSIAAVVVEPDRRTPKLLSDQGEAFYPKFKDPSAVKSIEVIDYDESTATARPFRVEFQRGRWVLPSHNNYAVDVGDRLVKTAAALMDLKKDAVRSDSAQEHGKYGVIDPFDSKVPELAGRGKRVTLRDAHKDVLADFIFGKPVEGKTGERFVRLPGQKRVYAVKTEADPSADFSDWVNVGVVRIQAASIRRINIISYMMDERMGGLTNMENLVLTREGTEWKLAGAEKLNTAAVQGMVNALENLKIVDVRPKPAPLSQDLKAGKLSLSLETAMSLRQKGFFITPNGRLLASEGEMSVETASGLVYALRFGDVVASGTEAKSAAAAQPNRYLFPTVSYDAQRAAKYGDASGAGERTARDLNARFSEWYYVIRGADFERLRLRKKDLAR